MICTGKIQNISRDWKSKKMLITLLVNESVSDEEVESLAKKEKLDIGVKEHKAKRSLDSNAYLWILCTKIAEVIRSSKDEVYEEMLQKYGYFHQDEDGYITVTVRADVDMSKIQGHWKFYKSNGKFSSYVMIKGSSEYNTAEMAKFIDSVVQEAKELGIQTATPEEIERMNKLWEKQRRVS